MVFTKRIASENDGDGGFIQQTLKRGQIFCSYHFHDWETNFRQSASINIQASVIGSERRAQKFLMDEVKARRKNETLTESRVSDVPIYSLSHEEKDNDDPNYFSNSEELYFSVGKYFFFIDIGSRGDTRRDGQLERTPQQTEKDANAIAEKIISRVK